jgi:hypothetical protein
VTDKGDKSGNTEDLVAQSMALTAREQAAGGPSGIIDSLVRGAGQQKRLTKWIGVLVLVNVVALALLGYGFTRIQSNTNTIKHNTVSSKANCQAENEFRSNDRLLYLYVEPIPPPPGLTAAQEVQRDKDDALLNSLLGSTFKLRKC